MESETVTKPVRDLVRRFNRGEILLPQFQRDYVWKVNKIRNLLDSLFNDLPIGGFYLWSPTKHFADPKPQAFGRAKFAKAASAYLIDGQQRLTSLEAAFGLFTGEDKRGAELQCYMDLAVQAEDSRRVTRLFVTYAGHKGIARRIDQGDPTLIDVKRFFEGKIDQQLRSDTQEALGRVPGWKAKRVSAAMERYEKAHSMLTQPVPCTTVHVDDRVAVEVFRRLNQGGSALREADVRAAELARGQAVNVLKRMREFVSEEQPTRLGFGFSFAFRALVMFHRGTSQLRTLPADWTETAGPHNRSLADSWSATRKALSSALHFIDDDVGWSRAALIPSVNALIVLAFALDKGGASPNAVARQRYRRWLYLTALRNVFQGSVETYNQSLHESGS
jgi:Protein of unknown function DUF262